MMQIFDGSNADEAWHKGLLALDADDFYHNHIGRGGRTREIIHAGFSIKDPRQRWIISRYPPLNPAFAIAETVWILNGRNDSGFLEFWNSQLPKFTGGERTLHGAYGFRLRRHLGIDQLERAYLALKNNPTGRQVVLQFWDARIDFPDVMGQPINGDIPCNLIAMLKIRDEHLEWMQISRSNDLFLGIPYNFVQFTTLQEVLVGWLDIGLGSYNHFSDSLHLYERNEKDITPSLQCSIQSPQNTDTLAFSKEESEIFYSELNRRMDAMQSEDLSPDFLLHLTTQDHLPVGIYNLLLVVGAETARRKRWQKVVTNLVERLSNPALTVVWKNWHEHVTGNR